VSEDAAYKLAKEIIRIANERVSDNDRGYKESENTTYWFGRLIESKEARKKFEEFINEVIKWPN